MKRIFIAALLAVTIGGANPAISYGAGPSGTPISAEEATLLADAETKSGGVDEIVAGEANPYVLVGSLILVGLSIWLLSETLNDASAL